MINKVQIDAKVPKSDENPEELNASIFVEYPDTIDEAVKLYGAEALLTNAFANWRVTLQANMRNGLKKGESNDQLQLRLGSAKMGIAAAGVKVDPVQAYLAMFASATPEEQKKMLGELQSRAAKK